MEPDSASVSLSGPTPQRGHVEYRSVATSTEDIADADPSVAPAKRPIKTKKPRKPSLKLFRDGSRWGKETKVAEKMALWTLYKNDGKPDAYHHKTFIDNVDKLVSPLGGEAVKRNLFWLSKKPETWPRFLTKHIDKEADAVPFELKGNAKGLDYFARFTPEGMKIIEEIEADEEQVDYFERKRAELIMPTGDAIHTVSLKRKRDGD